MCQSKSKKGKSRKLKMREEELQDLLLSLRLINMTTSERNHSFLRSASIFFSVSLLV